MHDESEWSDPEIPQEPGIPGSKTPEQTPSRDDPEVDRVPDAGLPDVDGEGHMAPERSGDGRAV